MEKKPAILLIYHVAPNAGYAIDTLQRTFHEMAKRIVKDPNRIYLAYPTPKIKDDVPVNVPFGNVITFDSRTRNQDQLRGVRTFVSENEIDSVFGFDLPVKRPCYRFLRQGGVRRIVSYQGAPMSGMNKGLRLLMKRLEVSLARYSPDLFIFESSAMAETATKGRGVPSGKTSVVHLGVDTGRYSPRIDLDQYAHVQFKIPPERKIIYYSGHMEERKGVMVLIRAAKTLWEDFGEREFHFLILGNRPGEKARFLEELEGSGAVQHVTFGGYRKDIPKILPGCYLGAIASTGWDSFTYSSLEIASCGVPLLVSRLQGLVETIEDGITGLSFESGNHRELASLISALLEAPLRRDKMGELGRKRILSGYSTEAQIRGLVEHVSRLA